MQVVGVIPARYASTRLPGKPLIKISGKPLLQWVIEGVQTSQKVNEFLVATDHEAIAELAQKCGVEAIMTSSDLPSGSDRVWAAIEDRQVDVALNIQGDEPLISGTLVDALAEPFFDSDEVVMSTLGRLPSLEDLESQNTAKIVLNHNSEALYFSRFPIPYSRNSIQDSPRGCLKHIGLYGYRKSFLKKFCEQGPVEIERAESLEQLRALYLGAKIKVVQVDHESWGVDTPEDVGKIEQILAEKR